MTGGTQGLGKGIALHLAEKGAEGIIICGRNVHNGEASVREIQDRGCACAYVQADLAREADCRQVVHIRLNL